MSDRTPLHKRVISIVLLVIILVILFWAVLTRNTSTPDFDVIYSAAGAFIKLRSPYQDEPRYFAPAWALVFMIPFASLPLDIARAAFFITSLLGFAFVGYKMGCKPPGLAAFILSAPVTHCLQTGNIEWLPLLGMFMPPPLGLIFLSMKPQTTIGVIIYILLRERKNGFRRVVQTGMPTAVLFVLSVLAYGLWFTRIGGAATEAGDLAIKIWPYGVPIGIALLVLAVREQKIELALASSPWLSPYTILLTWSGFVVSFAKSSKGMVAVSVLSWIIWLSFRYIR